MEMGVAASEGKSDKINGGRLALFEQERWVSVAWISGH